MCRVHDCRCKCVLCAQRVDMCVRREMELFLSLHWPHYCYKIQSITYESNIHRRREILIVFLSFIRIVIMRDFYTYKFVDGRGCVCVCLYSVQCTVNTQFFVDFSFAGANDYYYYYPVSPCPVPSRSHPIFVFSVFSFSFFALPCFASLCFVSYP